MSHARKPLISQVRMTLFGRRVRDRDQIVADRNNGKNAFILILIYIFQLELFLHGPVAMVTSRENGPSTYEKIAIAFFSFFHLLNIFNQLLPLLNAIDSQFCLNRFNNDMRHLLQTAREEDRIIYALENRFTRLSYFEKELGVSYGFAERDDAGRITLKHTCPISGGLMFDPVTIYVHDAGRNTNIAEHYERYHLGMHILYSPDDPRSPISNLPILLNSDNKPHIMDYLFYREYLEDIANLRQFLSEVTHRARPSHAVHRRFL